MGPKWSKYIQMIQMAFQTILQEQHPALKSLFSQLASHNFSVWVRF